MITERDEVSLRSQFECGKKRNRNNSVFEHFSRSDMILTIHLQYQIHQPNLQLWRIPIEIVHQPFESTLCRYELPCRQVTNDRIGSSSALHKTNDMTMKLYEVFHSDGKSLKSVCHYVFIFIPELVFDSLAKIIIYNYDSRVLRTLEFIFG